MYKCLPILVSLIYIFLLLFFFWKASRIWNQLDEGKDTKKGGRCKLWAAELPVPIRNCPCQLTMRNEVWQDSTWVESKANFPFFNPSFKMKMGRLNRSIRLSLIHHRRELASFNILGNIHSTTSSSSYINTKSFTWTLESSSSSSSILGARGLSLEGTSWPGRDGIVRSSNLKLFKRRLQASLTSTTLYEPPSIHFFFCPYPKSWLLVLVLNTRECS